MGRCGGFCQYYRDEPTFAKAGFIVDFVGNNTGVLFKLEVRASRPKLTLACWTNRLSRYRRCWNNDAVEIT